MVRTPDKKNVPAGNAYDSGGEEGQERPTSPTPTTARRVLSRSERDDGAIFNSQQSTQTILGSQGERGIGGLGQFAGLGSLGPAPAFGNPSYPRPTGAPKPAVPTFGQTGQNASKKSPVTKSIARRPEGRTSFSLGEIDPNRDRQDAQAIEVKDELERALILVFDAYKDKPETRHQVNTYAELTKLVKDYPVPFGLWVQDLTANVVTNYEVGKSLEAEITALKGDHGLEVSGLKKDNEGLRDRVNDGIQKLHELRAKLGLEEAQKNIALRELMELKAAAGPVDLAKYNKLVKEEERLRNMRDYWRKESEQKDERITDLVEQLEQVGQVPEQDIAYYQDSDDEGGPQVRQASAPVNKPLRQGLAPEPPTRHVSPAVSTSTSSGHSHKLKPPEPWDGKAKTFRRFQTALKHYMSVTAGFETKHYAISFIRDKIKDDDTWTVVDARTRPEASNYYSSVDEMWKHMESLSGVQMEERNAMPHLLTLQMRSSERIIDYQARFETAWAPLLSTHDEKDKCFYFKRSLNTFFKDHLKGDVFTNWNAFTEKLQNIELDERETRRQNKDKEATQSAPSRSAPAKVAGRPTQQMTYRGEKVVKACKEKNACYRCGDKMSRDHWRSCRTKKPLSDDQIWAKLGGRPSAGLAAADVEEDDSDDGEDPEAWGDIQVVNDDSDDESKGSS